MERRPKSANLPKWGKTKAEKCYC